MPPAIPPKTSEPLRKKVTENNSEIKKLQLMAKEIEKVGREPEESESSPPTETPPKPIKKTTVTTKVKRPDGEKTKRISSAIADRVPKKTAQRAKGSLALEKVDHESLTKKKVPSSVDRMLRPGTREDDPAADAPLKPNDKPTRVRSVRKIKAVKPEGREGERKTPEKKQKQAWTAAAQEDEKAPPEEKPPEEEEVVEVATEVPPPQEVPKIIPQPASATCSFFEKIQQGVRAYFSVRGNLKSDLLVEDKDKKVTEGGINLGNQTKPGLAKEVKEDSKKRATKVRFAGETLYYTFDHVRSKPTTVPKSHKPKTSRFFQRLKRKKVYRPKKHYVRIQIPRKGYFYRSTVQLKEPPPHTVSPSSQPHLERMASRVVPKNKPKVQVTGMAPTSAKVSDIFEKGMTRHGSEKSSDEDEIYESAMTTPMSVQQLEGNFETFIKCLNSALGREDLSRLGIRTEGLTLTEISDCEVASNMDLIEELNQEPNDYPQVESDASKHSIAASLMDDIDLHLELQNYLKAIDTSNTVTKKRTKNTLQPDHWHHEQLVSNPSFETNAEMEEKKSNTSFVSAASLNLLENSNGNCKGILEKASFRFSQMEEAGSLINSFFLLSRLHSLKRISLDKSNTYEKITPLKTSSRTSLKEKIRNKRKGIIMTQNLYRRLAAGFPKPPVRTFPSGLSLGCQSYTDDTDSFTSTTSTNTHSSDRLVSETTKKWSPTLKDLIEIYNKVLKENHKASQIGRSSTQRCISGPLNAFFNEKKKVAGCEKTSIVQAEIPKDGQKIEPPKLEDYVSMFQEILMSSLSIRQIAKLNSMLANLQNYYEKNYEAMKSVAKKKETNTQKVVAAPLKKPPVKKSVSFKETNKRDSAKPQRKIKKTTVKLELDSVLQSGGRKPTKQNTPKKVQDPPKRHMVTVELNGDKILVSEMSQFANENSLKALKMILSDCSETSDLIIENITQTRSETRQKKKKPPVRPKHPEGSLKPVPSKKNPPQDKKPMSLKNRAQTSKKISRYEYNQNQLKSQHPIEAIIESSERIEKPDFSSKYELQEVQKNIACDLNILREALTGVLRENQVFSKDLICEFNPHLWCDNEAPKSLDRTKSQIIRRKKVSITVIPKHPEVQKSVDDSSLIKSAPNNRKKLRKVLNTQNTYLCYPSLQKQTNPSKKPSKFYKKLVSCVSSCARQKDKKPVRTLSTLDELTPKPSTNTILFLNTEITPECCSVEFLFNDKTGSHSINISPKSSVCQIDDKPVEDPPKIQNKQESPIVIHPAKNEDDDTSFPSLMIQSDSYIRCSSTVAIARNKIESVFKSNSDMKFYPGRCPENSEEENPLVTFVLTPKQGAEADLPAKQVKVVEKPNGETESQIPLESIEKFIESLSKSNRKKICCKKPKPGYRFNEKKPKVVQRKKTNILNQRTQAYDRTLPYECQKKTNKVKNKPKSEPKKTVAVKSDKEDPTIVCPSLLQILTENNTNSDLLNIVKSTITGMSGFKGKQEILDAIEIYSKQLPESKQVELNQVLETELPLKETTEPKPEPELEAEKTTHDEKKVRTFKIRIHCNNHNQSSGFKANAIEHPTQHSTVEESSGARGEIELLDSLVSKKEEKGEHLRRTPSAYFDAVGDAADSAHSTPRGEHSQKVCFRINISTEKTANEKASKEKSKTEPQDNLQAVLTPSDICLLSKINESSEEEILNKIIQNLHSNNVHYSILLLEALLKKTKLSEKKNVTHSAKLQEVLKSVESKSKNLMVKMEKNGWLKILSFLEEISNAFETGMENKTNSELFSNHNLQLKVADSLDYLRKQVKDTKKFMEKIKILNDKRLVDFQRFSQSSSELRNTSSETETLDAKNLFHKIRNSISGLKNKLVSNWSQLLTGKPCGDLGNCDEDEDYSSDEDDYPRPVHSTRNATDILDSEHQPKGNASDSLRSLKKKIRQQRFCVQYLMNHSYEPVSPEIQTIKNKVAEKMKFLEQTVTWLDKSREDEGWDDYGKELGEDGSYLSIRSAYKNFLKRSNVETCV